MRGVEVRTAETAFPFGEGWEGATPPSSPSQHPYLFYY